MMHEIVKRRYGGSLTNTLPTPDLILIDGGMGQLNAAIEALDKIQTIKPDIISLAKKFEEIYVPMISTPIVLPKNSDSLLLLQSIRNEAHRFAINYHKLLRRKTVVK